jgi:hypothetical protein
MIHTKVIERGTVRIKDTYQPWYVDLIIRIKSFILVFWSITRKQIVWLWKGLIIKEWKDWLSPDNRGFHRDLFAVHTDCMNDAGERICVPLLPSALLFSSDAVWITEVGQKIGSPRFPSVSLSVVQFPDPSVADVGTDNSVSLLYRDASSHWFDLFECPSVFSPIWYSLVVLCSWKETVNPSNFVSMFRSNSTWNLIRSPLSLFRIFSNSCWNLESIDVPNCCQG